MYGYGLPLLSVVFEKSPWRSSAVGIRYRDDVVAARARLEFLGVEEEQLVAAARLADGTADRIPPVALPRGRSSDRRSGCSSWLLAFQSELRSTSYSEPRNRLVPLFVTARDLQPARAAVLGLVVRDEHLDLGDRLDVDVDERAVAAGVHRR